MTKGVGVIFLVALLLGGCAVAFQSRHCSGAGGETFALPASEVERLVADRVKTVGVELRPSSMRYVGAPEKNGRFQRVALKGAGEGFADLYIESRGPKQTLLFVTCRAGVEHTETLAKMFYQDLRLWLTLKE